MLKLRSFRLLLYVSEPARAADGMQIVRKYGRHCDFVYNLSALDFVSPIRDVSRSQEMKRNETNSSSRWK